MSEIASAADLSVAIIICTRNRNALLERCLGSLERLNVKAQRVLIVDNAPESDTVPSIAAKYGADYVLEPRPGLSRARNCGANVCSEDILAYIDDDMVPHPDWLSSLLSGFSDANVAVVTGPVVPLEIWKANPMRCFAEKACAPTMGLASLSPLIAQAQTGSSERILAGSETETSPSAARCSADGGASRKGWGVASPSK